MRNVVFTAPALIFSLIMAVIGRNEIMAYALCGALMVSVDKR